MTWPLAGSLLSVGASWTIHTRESGPGHKEFQSFILARWVVMDFIQHFTSGCQRPFYVPVPGSRTRHVLPGSSMSPTSSASSTGTYSYRI
ncbi:hypothetical protein BZA05DRAFT_393847 [Tricharina praecox]|uniref:uncharacterized protein n=1 Tax=Tricharina praecox TaxID=43433 RepID=UPI00222122AE|nr:uncharacterized protein BZA05DRAFT_393847 [Tricharina praecox]KAI5854312.1 hypothetical protein BZA05DRAFT_393847 [Tricharina praecox]